ncbi:MAG: GNAT family N-acetyltransferase [Dehalococcoidia bacterium]|jgi:GNAT superfamily N-acetyltransferase|nr:GNAT family N-acetyltransferase [Dehalococcoidia bacterium]
MLIALDRRDVGQAAEVCAAAFYEGPYTRFLFPDPRDRDRYMRPRFQRMLLHAILYGELYATSEKVEGVMSLLPHPPARVSLWRRLRVRDLRSIRYARPVQERVAVGAAYLTERRKHHMPGPHMMLETLVVRPELQGRGFGTGLLRHALARADAEQLPLYLDTFALNSVEMYRRFGFHVIEEGRIRGMDSPVYLMSRQPQAPAMCGQQPDI